jgi:pimeloyl-ACP methyl ester carboxylesterase
LKRQVPELRQVTLVGLRLGATIAAAVAATRSDVDRLVLWDPVTDGAAYMQSVLRANLMAQMAIHRKIVEDREALVTRMQRGELINVEGYDLGEPLFLQTSALNLTQLLAARQLLCLVVAIAGKSAAPREELSLLAKQCHDLSIVSVVEEPFWREIRTFYRRADQLFRATFEWLEMPA